MEDNQGLNLNRKRANIFVKKYAKIEGLLGLASNILSSRIVKINSVIGTDQ